MAPFDSKALTLNYLFDSVIYLPGSPCEQDVGLVLTLAHELCRFLQYSNARGTWAANILIGKFGSHAIRVYSDIPTEHEARQVAKRVAQEVFDEQLVKDHIEVQLREATCPDDHND